MSMIVICVLLLGNNNTKMELRSKTILHSKLKSIEEIKERIMNNSSDFKGKKYR